MKLKTIITAFVFLFSLTAFAQQKADTTIQLTFKINDYRALINTIDQNVDSKKLSADIFKFLQERLVMIPPKQDTITNKQPAKK